MKAEQVTAILSGIAIGLSAIAFIISLSFRFGSASAKLSSIEAQQSKMDAEMVRKSDLAPIQIQLAEIRGMFRLELKGD